MTNNEKLQEAIDKMWKLEGILTQSEILEITGFLVSKKEAEA